MRICKDNPMTFPDSLDARLDAFGGADALETGIAALEDEALEIQAQLNAVQSLQMQIDELGQDLAGLPGDGAGRDVLRGTIDGLREQWSGLPSEFELTANFAAVEGDLAERRTGLKDIADLRKALADKPTLERVDERRGNLPDADDLKRQLREVTVTLVELQAQLDAPPEGVDALVSPYQDE